MVQKDVQTFTQLIKHANIYLRFCKTEGLDAGVFNLPKRDWEEHKIWKFDIPFYRTEKLSDIEFS